MIYMVDHVYTDPGTEPEWHAWYSVYLQKLLSVPGIHSTQRFKALNHAPSRFLAMYSIDSIDVYTSDGYKKIGGGGSQSARFHQYYQLWTRNLFDGAVSAPVVREGERVLVLDCAEKRDGPLYARATWVKSVGLHMTTPYRAFMVLSANEAVPAVEGSFLYEPFTACTRKP
jgi:hypothetical protein